MSYKNERLTQVKNVERKMLAAVHERLGKDINAKTLD